MSRDGFPLIAGQSVTIDVPDGELLRSAAKVYLLPLAGLLAGPALVRWTGAGSEAAALIAGVTGVVLGWAAGPALGPALAAEVHGASRTGRAWTLNAARTGYSTCARAVTSASSSCSSCRWTSGPRSRLLRVVDVDRDADLAVRFGLRVPVLEAGGVVLCEGVYDAPRVRQALQV